MNLSQLQAECGRLLSDPNNDRWSASTLLSRINTAQTEIEGQTNAVKTQEAITPVSGVMSVNLNANTMNVMRAEKTLSDRISVRPFPGISREKINYLYPDWQQWGHGEPQFWILDESLSNRVDLAPIPDDANAFTNAYTFWEIRKPADLVNSTDIPFDSSVQMIPYHMSIVHWVVALCFQDDGTQEALAKSKFHRSGSMLQPGEYEKEIGRILAEFDNPDAIPANILYRPQGGRSGTWWIPTKSNPLAFP